MSAPIKINLIIAYDGTAYQGWQWQRIGLGVQQRVEEALAKLFKSGPRLHSSSRTDTGVHALGMVAHFEVPAVEMRRLTFARLPIAINSLLPHDIRIQSAVRKPAKFHARFDATSKQYRYFVWNHVGMNPLLRHTAWHVPRKLDLKAMRAAAKLFLGEQDFQSFAANPGYKRTTTVRHLTRCEIKKSGPQITFIIEGDGFLYRMCRGIAGTIVQVGMGKFTVDEVATMLGKADRRVAGMSAPAHGLVLWKVYYSTQGRKAAKARNQVETEE